MLKLFKFHKYQPKFVRSRTLCKENWIYFAQPPSPKTIPFAAKLVGPDLTNKETRKLFRDAESIHNSFYRNNNTCYDASINLNKSKEDFDFSSKKLIK
jgi:hypothetical protein